MKKLLTKLLTQVYNHPFLYGFDKDFTLSPYNYLDGNGLYILEQKYCEFIEQQEYMNSMIRSVWNEPFSSLKKSSRKR